MYAAQLADAKLLPLVPKWDQINAAILGALNAIALTGADKSATLDGAQSDGRRPSAVAVAIQEPDAISSASGSSYLGAPYERDPRRPALRPRAKRGRSAARVRLIPYLLVGPAVVLLVVFGVLPILVAAVVSLTDLDIGGLGNPETVRFIGLDNYERLFADPAFWRVARQHGLLRHHRRPDHRRDVRS